MDYYADSSFLVSCYLADAHTPKAKALLARIGISLPFTQLHSLEIRNAFQLGVFRGLISTSQASKAWLAVEEDLRRGRLFDVSAKWSTTFRTAALLSKRHARVTGARSLDILHGAFAISLRANEFITFDARQAALVALAGLKVSTS